MRASRFSRYIDPSPCLSLYVVGNKKKVQRNLYSPCPKAHRESSRVVYARGRRSLIRTSIRSLSQLTKPHLALSYLTSFAVPVRRVLQCLASPRNPFVRPSARSLARSFVHSRAVLRVAQIPLSLVATVLLQSSPHIHTLKKKYRFCRIERYV